VRRYGEKILIHNECRDRIHVVVCELAPLPFVKPTLFEQCLPCQLHTLVVAVDTVARYDEVLGGSGSAALIEIERSRGFHAFCSHPIAQLIGRFSQVGVTSGAPLKEAKEPGTHRFRGERGIFNGTSEEFVSVRGFSLAKMSSDSPYLSLVVFIPLDELCGEREALTNRNLEGGDAVVVADEVSGDTGLIEVEILVFASFHGRLQAVFGVINASAHSCAVSFPGKFSELDGGDETSDDLSKAFGGDFVVGGQGSEDSIGRHGSIVVKDGG